MTSYFNHATLNEMHSVRISTIKERFINNPQRLQNFLKPLCRSGVSTPPFTSRAFQKHTQPFQQTVDSLTTTQASSTGIMMPESSREMSGALKS